MFLQKANQKIAKQIPFHKLAGPKQGQKKEERLPPETCQCSGHNTADGHKSISHRLKTRGNHCWRSIIPGFLRWCRISSIHSSIQNAASAPQKLKPGSCARKTKSHELPRAGSFGCAAEVCQLQLRGIQIKMAVVVKTDGIPFWGRCTTQLRTYFSGDWDVHWRYGILTHGQMMVRTT